MVNLAQLLRKAKNVEDRARILKKELSPKKNDIEKFNNGLILDINEHEGLKIGDKVMYINGFGKYVEGYISHFFTRDSQTITPAIIPIDGFGYSTHNGKGLPQKLLE